MKLKWLSEDELDIKPKGKAPQGRYDHGMVRYGNHIVIFGGRKLNKDAPFADSVYLLGLSDLTWTKLSLNTKLHSNCMFLRSEFTYAVVPKCPDLIDYDPEDNPPSPDMSEKGKRKRKSPLKIKT